MIVYRTHFSSFLLHSQQACPNEEKEVDKVSYFLGGSQIQLEGTMDERDERVLRVRLLVIK